MRELYRQDLAQLGDELEHMSRNVTRAIERATDALREGDLTMAEQTIDADERLDDAARNIDEMCVSLLALQAPVASDLRLILAGLRLSQTLERQGDLARHIALIARSTYPSHSITELAAPQITRMGEAAVKMARLTQQLVATQDLALAAQVQDEDDVLDDLQVEVRRMITDESNDFTRAQVIDLTLAARFLERFGDHAVSVARRVAYIVEGTAATEEGFTGRL
ncbi:phosphate signaling complex protein PhoU [Actinomyces polynesiensis]|uniref:phosphate signaling complex protein PhoU n=1 Tax=Actinomyces polynesiensis TaxID=1325934 RepID=UPI0005BE5FFE|nr:phosphate signaling complex protein PhoU [Actinomyces polynesiensis]